MFDGDGEGGEYEDFKALAKAEITHEEENAGDEASETESAAQTTSAIAVLFLTAILQLAMH